MSWRSCRLREALFHRMAKIDRERPILGRRRNASAQLSRSSRHGLRGSQDGADPAIGRCALAQLERAA